MNSELQATIERLSAENAALQLQIQAIRQATIEECAKYVEGRRAGRKEYSDMWLELCKLANGLRALSSGSPAPLSAAAWISVEERLPEVTEGKLGRFIVACIRPFNGKTYVFEAHYLNNLMLDDVNGDGEERPFSGWYDAKEHAEYSDFYSAVEGEITHWMELPPAPAQPTDKGAN